MYKDIVSDISANLQSGRAKAVKELVQSALDNGVSVDLILSGGLLSGMDIIGEKFRTNDIFVPEVLLAARAMNIGLNVLKPLLTRSNVRVPGKVCIGTVKGDLHNIGKNLVKMMIEGKGIETIDLGVDVPAESFVHAVRDWDCQVVCCSALLTTTMVTMKDIVKAIEKAGLHEKVKVMVGGAPVTEAFCRNIGADSYTEDAASAADAAYTFCAQMLSA